jgi:hypothetical protein
MKRRFEEILAECLEAVTTGQRTVEKCLALYPQWRDRLEPLLWLGHRLGQASFPEADPAFQEAARERFLAAAQARAAVSRRPRRFLPALPVLSRWSWRPASAPSWRRVAATMAAALLIGFVGFSSFVVASAGDSLPGDWRYPVKQLTERTRLALTFGEDARREYRIRLAEERLHEVQGLASQERQISESVLRQLVETTEPLVRALEPDSVPRGQIERITDLTAEQKDTLDRVAPLVEEKAVDELEAARVVSSEGHDKAVQALATALSEEKPPEEVSGLTTPGAGTPTAPTGASPTPAPTPASTATSQPSSTPAVVASPGPLATEEPSPIPDTTPQAAPAGEPTPAEASATPSPAGEATVRMELVPLPEDHSGGVRWNLIVVGDFSVAVPAEENGWIVSSPLPSEDPPLRGMVGVAYLVRGRPAAAVLILVADGTASVFGSHDGVFGKIDADRASEVLPAPVAEVISHVLESITLSPS